MFCIIPSVSQLFHDSTILPSSKRSIPIPLVVARVPVGSMPMSVPSCVPVPAQRVTTLSPSAIWSSISKCRSGKASRYMAMVFLKPSRPSFAWGL